MNILEFEIIKLFSYSKQICQEINGFHPEMALLFDLCVNLRDFLCDVLCVRIRAIL